MQMAGPGLVFCPNSLSTETPRATPMMQDGPKKPEEPADISLAPVSEVGLWCSLGPACSGTQKYRAIVAKLRSRQRSGFSVAQRPLVAP